MRRFRLGLGVAAATAVFLLLAGAWPDGADRGAERDAAEPGDSASPSIAGAPAGEPSPTGEADPTPVEAEPTDGAEESSAPAHEPPSERSSGDVTAEPDTPARDAHGGPMGTRDHTGSNGVALTFDDGPDPNWTPKVLAELRERGVKATFCVIGAYAEAHPDLIADIVHDGHTLCSHTWFHELDLGERSTEEIRANLQRTEDAIEKAAPGAEVEYFRHPGGQWTDRAVEVAAEMGMESLHWDIDPSDWDRRTTEAQIRDRVLDAKPGSIILLHDGASNQEAMFGALGAILDEFARREYALVAL
ncbi:polysaccharide deacetylase family protein [Glycomyces tenuis]|uniref:polysaccharide deacetylase family protein n=1 Tax=Glycomyces tenuis TaxID=58116 RepID=UPI0003FC76DD|nr:polysaccharide deacetylase family protein [Glycomyces tenuis]